MIGTKPAIDTPRGELILSHTEDRQTHIIGVTPRAGGAA